MIFFNLPKPRRFHHEYIYFDERKERLKRLEEKLKGKKEGELEVDANEKEYYFDFRSNRNANRKINSLQLSFFGSIIFVIILAVLLIIYLK
ncbi:hypothetical protein [Prevotella pallens]|uniref:hypothetical protein n=1 Tax=Prevotella pallens TaxID=60133 RepID=UPI001CAAE3C9|nr:hypothetical protein [Prevotella pallens]MBF1484410.1 hypothetical protein [Prevotella pallens]MBF1499097.1 hypothetical protein [Prevotella pallens]